MHSLTGKSKKYQSSYSFSRGAHEFEISASGIHILFLLQKMRSSSSFCAFLKINNLIIYDVQLIKKTLTNQLPLLITAPSEKPLNRYSANQETSALYGTQILITTFIRACHLSLSWERLIQSTLLILFHKDKFNIIFLSTSMPKSYKFYIFFIFLHQNPVCTSPVPLRATYPYAHSHKVENFTKTLEFVRIWVVFS